MWDVTQRDLIREGEAPAEPFHECTRAFSPLWQSEFAAGKGSAGASPSRLRTCGLFRSNTCAVCTKSSSPTTAALTDPKTSLALCMREAGSAVAGREKAEPSRQYVSRQSLGTRGFRLRLIGHAEGFVFLAISFALSSIEKIDDHVQRVYEDAEHQRCGVAEHDKDDLCFATVGGLNCLRLATQPSIQLVGDRGDVERVVDEQPHAGEHDHQ